jgi:hypothetical protein
MLARKRVMGASLSKEERHLFIWKNANMVIEQTYLSVLQIVETKLKTNQS